MNKNLSKEEIINQAIKFHFQGNIPEAAKYYLYFINQGFKDHRVFSNYGLILQDLGKLKEAESSIRKAIEIKPDYANAHCNLGNVLKDLGKLKEAELSTRKAISINPNFVNAHYTLGLILRDHGDLSGAELSTRKAISLNPDFDNAHYNLGTILRDLGDLNGAELSYRKSIKLNPHFKDAYFNLFRHYEEINHLEKLKESLNEFNKIDKIKNELILFNARLSYRYKEYETAKECIDNISLEWIENININQNIIFWNYKAFIEDKVGNYDIAYSCFEKSQKNLIHERFSKYAYLQYIDSYKNSILKKRRRFNHFNDEIEDSNLAFLIGFPRSGTTLLDTILRSHKDIEVIEEKPIISTIEQLIKSKFNIKLDSINYLSKDNILILRKKYFELLKKYTNNDSTILIDKLPLNTIALPLINLLFPDAKVIFTHRHPYDTVLSCFQQIFKPNIAMANLISLKSSSIIYDQVMDVWDIYKNNLTFDFITSKYEHLIEDLDGHTLKILKFLGVRWDKNIKNYRKTALERGKINTPSSSQVVLPIYKSSIDKWKNYEKYFEDCHQYLNKWVSYFDY